MFTRIIAKTFSTQKLRLAIVGSGPAGFYISGLIKREYPDCTIDIFEKELLPFGLIRYGVAPDHQNVKKIINNQTEIGRIDGIRYMGGIEIGKDVSIQELDEYYSTVTYAYGTQLENTLNIPGEDLPNVFYSYPYINYYNCHPAYPNFPLKKWENLRTVSVIGNGNVALDVTRMLAIENSGLMGTDVNLGYMDLVKKRSLKNIIIYGRRGMAQSNFTMKELREMTKGKNCKLWLVKEDIDLGNNEITIEEMTLHSTKSNFQQARALKRKMEFFHKSFGVVEEKDLNSLLDRDSGDKINIVFRFLLKPTEFRAGEDGFVDRIVLRRQKLAGSHYKQSALDDLSDEKIHEYPTDLVMKCIGYKGYNIDPENLPFDYKKGIIPNHNGCMLTAPGSESFQVGKYVAGWIRQGPLGVIDTTLKGSEETWVNMRRHLRAGKLPMKTDAFPTLLEKFKEQRVSFGDWEKINKHEISEGAKVGMCRVKMNDSIKIRNFLG